MIDRIYKVVEILTNKERKGKVTPSEYNRVLNDVINQRQEDLFSDLEGYFNRSSRRLTSPGLSDMPGKYSEKIQHYYESSPVSRTATETTEPAEFLVPSTLRYVDSVYATSFSEDLVRSKLLNRPVQPAKNSFAFYSSSLLTDTAPSLVYPIFLREEGRLLIYPNEIDSIRLWYLRSPRVPNWTYTVVGTVELFNPSDPTFVDVDAHPSEENILTIMVLRSFGINLKEAELIAVTQQMLQQEEAKQQQMT